MAKENKAATLKDRGMLNKASVPDSSYPLQPAPTTNTRPAMGTREELWCLDIRLEFPGYEVTIIADLNPSCQGLRAGYYRIIPALSSMCNQPESISLFDIPLTCPIFASA